MTLYDLLQEDECILSFHIEGEMTKRHIIAPCGGDGAPTTDNIGACIEQTLHRILENGGNDDNVYEILGAVKDMQCSSDERYCIDLGYVIPGPIDRNIEPTGERKLSQRTFLAWLKNTFTIEPTAMRLIENVISVLDKADMKPQSKTFALMDILDAGIGITDEETAMCAFD